MSDSGATLLSRQQNVWAPCASSIRRVQCLSTILHLFSVTRSWWTIIGAHTTQNGHLSAHFVERISKSANSSKLTWLAHTSKKFPNIQFPNKFPKTHSYIKVFIRLNPELYCKTGRKLPRNICYSVGAQGAKFRGSEAVLWNLQEVVHREKNAHQSLQNRAQKSQRFPVQLLW